MRNSMYYSFSGSSSLYLELSGTTRYLYCHSWVSTETPKLKLLREKMLIEPYYQEMIILPQAELMLTTVLCLPLLAMMLIECREQLTKGSMVFLLLLKISKKRAEISEHQREKFEHS